MKVLVTGSAGYIASHAIVELIERGIAVVGVDNLSGSSPKSHSRIEKLVDQRIPFYQVDVRHRNDLRQVFEEHQFDGVLHFAGLKAVAQSQQVPLDYYDVNVFGTLNLLRLMQQYGVAHFIFSSSATVYGVQEQLPITEQAVIAPTNPYGTSKWFAEQVIKDFENANGHADFFLTSGILRYFNPVGAHSSGLIGEEPRGRPNNLMPYLTQSVAGIRGPLKVYGDDYATPDGTGIRDYIHVVDLAKAHVKAIEHLINRNPSFVVNLGTGRGASVLELIQAFERANSKSVVYEITSRRQGDVEACWADPSLAEKLLNWRAELSLDEMCASAWNWQRNSSSCT